MATTPDAAANTLLGRLLETQGRLWSTQMKQTETAVADSAGRDREAFTFV